MGGWMILKHKYRVFFFRMNIYIYITKMIIFIVFLTTIIALHYI